MGLTADGVFISLNRGRRFVVLCWQFELEALGNFKEARVSGDHFLPDDGISALTLFVALKDDGLSDHHPSLIVPMVRHGRDRRRVLLPCHLDLKDFRIRDLDVLPPSMMLGSKFRPERRVHHQHRQIEPIPATGIIVSNDGISKLFGRADVLKDARREKDRHHQNETREDAHAADLHDNSLSPQKIDQYWRLKRSRPKDSRFSKPIYNASYHDALSRRRQRRGHVENLYDGGLRRALRYGRLQPLVRAARPRGHPRR